MSELRYPHRRYLAFLVNAVIQLDKKENDRLITDLSELTWRERCRLNNSVELYVNSVKLKSFEPYVGASVELSRLIMDLLDKDSSPINLDPSDCTISTFFSAFYRPEQLEGEEYENTLKNELSILLRDHRFFMNTGLWKAIDGQMKVDYFIHQNFLHSLQNEMQCWIDRLDEKEGPVPYLNLNNTIRLIQSYASILMRHQEGTIVIHYQEFCDWAIEEEGLRNEYIPFWEAIYYLSGNQGWKFESASEDGVFIDHDEVYANIREKTVIFNPITRMLKIGARKELQFNDGIQMQILEKILKEHNEGRTRRWFPGDFQDLPRYKGKNSAKRGFDNLAAKIRKEGAVTDFIRVTKEYMEISPLYTLQKLDQ